jgi:hypothetical protein
VRGSGCGGHRSSKPCWSMSGHKSLQELPPQASQVKRGLSRVGPQQSRKHQDNRERLTWAALHEGGRRSSRAKPHGVCGKPRAGCNAREVATLVPGRGWRRTRLTTSHPMLVLHYFLYIRVSLLPCFCCML